MVSGSIIVGDKFSDIKAEERVGVTRGFLMRTGQPIETPVGHAVEIEDLLDVGKKISYEDQLR